MGAKTCMLVYATEDPREVLSRRPEPDRDKSLRLAEQLFPGEKLTPMEDGSLLWTSPEEGVLCVGCFPGVSVVAAIEFGIDYPSQLDKSFIAAGGSGSVYLHAMHSVVDWFAFACWKDGTLTRSLSLSPDCGILEDIGQKLPFEKPYWDGEFPAIDPEEEEELEDAYPFPFQPLELGEAALLAFFGYQIEGPDVPLSVDAEKIPLMQFKRSK